MFHSVPDTEKVSPPVTLSEVIPLSVLGLDLGVPGEGWPTFLGRRAIAIVPDFLGRDSIGVDAARRLLDERRGDELRRRKRAAVQQEEEEEEADKLRRAQIWTGVSADAIPVGVHPATAMLQASKDARPRRVSPLEEALDNGGSVFHSFGQSDEGES